MGGWVDGWMGEVVQIFLCPLAPFWLNLFPSLFDALRLQNSFLTKPVSFSQPNISETIQAIKDGWFKKSETQKQKRETLKVFFARSNPTISPIHPSTHPPIYSSTHPLIHATGGHYVSKNPRSARSR
jgi:hypothetical protein